MNTADTAALRAAPAARAPSDPASPLVAALRATCDSGRTRPLPWRLQQLAGLRRLIAEREAEIHEALRADLGKPRFESFATETAFVDAELREMLPRLKGWLKPERVPTPMAVMPGRSWIQREPLGVVLVIGAWNYPFNLTMAPLLGALGAGNCVVVKPSEVSPHTSALLARRLPEYLDPDAVRVVEGGVAETTALLAERFDHIFYTGNGHVGRIVMTAAARHLTPVTLELGGKSPVIVDASCDLEVTARRIAWTKWNNAGQTCVAPDYVLAHAAIKAPLIEKLRACITRFYGLDPRQSPDFARIVNVRHHRRLMALMGSGRVVAGGQADEAERYIAPTVLDDVPEASPVMGEEIFGPILPVLAVQSVEEAIAFVNRRDKPLALYVFASDRRVQEAVIDRTSAGGVTINHGFMHFAVPGLPFGGVGASGMGAYHGRHSFEVFSHAKGVLKMGTLVDPNLTYPPYAESKFKWIRRLL
jgi:aldehyde dehydrogenase (NAD+)